MPKTLSQEIASTEEGRRLLQQESAIMEVTELICEIMEEENVSRSELSDRLGKTKGYITQLLDGRANMTIRTIADVFGALGGTLHFCADRENKQFRPRVTRLHNCSNVENASTTPAAIAADNRTRPPSTSGVRQRELS
jgi:transcriptional regulator with XRE-family HTH domain